MVASETQRASGARRRFACLRLVAACLTSFVPLDADADPVPASASMNAVSTVGFTTPSGSIGCSFAEGRGNPVADPDRREALIFCGRVGPTYLRFVVGAHGPARLIREPEEQQCCGTLVLAYGETRRLGPFACTARLAGLTCQRDDGAGFFIGRWMASAILAPEPNRPRRVFVAPLQHPLVTLLGWALSVILLTSGIVYISRSATHASEKLMR